MLVQRLRGGILELVKEPPLPHIIDVDLAALALDSAMALHGREHRPILAEDARAREELWHGDDICALYLKLSHLRTVLLWEREVELLLRLQHGEAGR